MSKLEKETTVMRNFHPPGHVGHCTQENLNNGINSLGAASAIDVAGLHSSSVTVSAGAASFNC